MNEIKANSRASISVEKTRDQMVMAITRKIGIIESIAIPIAEAVLDAFREHYAGREIYIPAKRKEARNEAILSEFNGRNHKELGKKHGLGRAQIYRIVGKK